MLIWLEALTSYDWTLYVGLITLVVVCVQAYLMIRQLKITDRQLHIMNRQDELLGRRPTLCFKVRSRYNNQENTDRTLEFIVENSGNKAAHDFYWHVMIPQAFAQNEPFASGTGRRWRTEDRTVTENGVVYVQYRGFSSEPVYPGRENDLCSLRVQGDNVAGSVEIYWAISAEDGVFPPAGIMAPLEVPA